MNPTEAKKKRDYDLRIPKDFNDYYFVDFAWQDVIPVVYESQLNPEPQAGKHHKAVDITEPFMIHYGGYRGMGKSAGLAYAGTLAMLAGMKAIMNIPLRLYVIRRSGEKVLLQSQPMDMQAVYMLQHDFVFLGIDEYQYFASALKTNSTKNTLMDAATQQIRKGDINFQVTAKSTRLLDYIANFEIDISIWCHDAYRTPEGYNKYQKGDKFFWYIRDLSGNWTFHPYSSYPYTHQRQLWFKPMKGCYPHKMKLDPLEALAGVELDLEKMKISNRQSKQDLTPEQIIEVQNKALDIVGRYGDVPTFKLYKEFGVNGNGDRAILTQVLWDAGIRKRQIKGVWSFVISQDGTE